MVGDENQVEWNDQESSSENTKKKFGIFRLPAIKSKGSKYDSSDSLTVQSRNSTDFDRSESEFSLQESSGSVESAAAETSEQSEKIVLDKAKESPVNLQSNVWTGSPKNTNTQSLEIVSRPVQSSVIFTEPNQTRAKGDHEEGAKLTLEENYLSYEKETSHVASLQSSVVLTEPNKTRANAKDIKKVHDREITRSEEKSVYTVVSTTISNTGYVSTEMREEVEIGTLNKNKQQVHNQKGQWQDDRLRDEKPAVQAVTNKEQSQLLEQVDKRREVVIGTLNQEDVEEPIMLTYKDSKGPPQDQCQDEEVKNEAPLDEEAILLVYPDQTYDQNERQDDAVDEETPVVEAVSSNKERQLLEQVDEFLKLEANAEGSLKHKSESHVGIVKKKGKEKMWLVIDEDNELPQKSIDIVSDDSSEKLAQESSSFDEKNSHFLSTPERLSIDNKKNTAKEINNEEHKKMEPAKENETSSEVKFKLREKFLNAMEDVKISSAVLMAQLAEVNKKLQELKEELLELLKKGRDESKEASTEEVPIQS